jgi:hypothetical protein
MNIDYTQDSLTLTNTCPECIAQEQLCTDCVDEADARLTDKAYELVDEGNVQYKHQWLLTTEPSGHDWVTPVTYRGKAKKATRVTEHRNQDGYLLDITVEFVEPTNEYDERNEFLPPIVQLHDGGELDNVWELSDETQRKRETECHWCHLLTPKQFNDCQSCDKPLEYNVR